MITSMGFSGYFLIVWDLIRFARDNGIRVGPGRGSAAGSVVSYSLRITDLDPLRYGLIFERFLNPGRLQMPDIDMDFDERRRDEVIRYVASKYGSDRVAQIITFQTIKGKQGIRDAARVLGFPASVGDRLCKMYPPALLGRRVPDRAGARVVDRAPRRVRARARGQGDRGHRQGARGPSARGLGARGRRRDRRRAAGHVPPAQAVEGLPRRLAAHRHPVRHARRREPRAAEDGLPRPADPLGDRGHALAPASPRRRAGHRPRAAGRREGLRDAGRGPTPPACSSWRAAGCAR